MGAKDKNEFAIIDVETTGGGPSGNRMTEIAVFIHNGERVLQKFQSLVNPGCSIPPSISYLTGINNDMVSSAPRFEAIAKRVHELTAGRVFVAHNVSFDYGVLKHEFERLGADFNRTKLCTVRLSRKVFPGLKSYSLGRLCESLGIFIENRHRAEGDAKATVELFERIIENDIEDVLGFSLNKQNRESNLPPNLPRQSFVNLPEAPGVYYFHDAGGKVIYVGKAKNIKNRVSSHFSDSGFYKFGMKELLCDISFEKTGNELVALLLESEEIRKHWPQFNRAQKYTRDTRVLISYVGNDGITRLDIVTSKLAPKPLITFPGSIKARSFLQNILEKYELCPKYCGLEKNTGPCFLSQLKQCRGVCSGMESADEYNLRVKKAIESFTLAAGTFLISEKGRTQEERALILIENGTYRGFSFVSIEEQIDSFESASDLIKIRKDNSDIQKIIASYLRSEQFNPRQIIPLL